MLLFTIQDFSAWMIRLEAYREQVPLRAARHFPCVPFRDILYETARAKGHSLCCHLLCTACNGGGGGHPSGHLLFPHSGESRIPDISNTRRTENGYNSHTGLDWVRHSTKHIAHIISFHLPDSPGK